MCNPREDMVHGTDVDSEAGLDQSSMEKVEENEPVSGRAERSANEDPKWRGERERKRIRS